jgi:hypothetical protein
MSLLRLGICQPNDWSGSAVDFVERAGTAGARQERTRREEATKEVAGRLSVNRDITFASGRFGGI